MLAIGPLGIGPFELLLIVGIVLVFWAAWRICEKVGWSRWLILLYLIPFVGFFFTLALVWEALPKAGHSRWLTVLLLVPLLNALMLLWLAFRRWPDELERGSP